MTAYSAAMQVVHNEADADDIAQETMVKLYLNIDALDEDRVEGWVRVAAKNLGIDYQRKAQRFDWNELDEDLRAEEMELPTLVEEEKQERNHFFREMMDALKDQVSSLKARSIICVHLRLCGLCSPMCLKPATIRCS